MQILAEIRRYAAIGWMHRWKSIALAWVICLAGWVYVANLPNQYRASARLYADADVILGQLLRGIAVDSSPVSQVELLQRTLLSRPNLERVAVRTGLDLRAEGGAARDRLLEGLARQVRIAAQSRNLFTITYTDTDPRMARSVVQALLTLFMEQAASNDRQQMENARNFVNQQIAAYESQLREAEQRRAEFRARYLDLLPNDGGVTRLQQARIRLAQLRGELEDATGRRAVLQQQLAATPATLAPEATGGGGGGPAGDPRLAEAERQLRELRLQFTEQHPAVVAARNAVATAAAGAPRIATARRPAPASRGGRTHLRADPIRSSPSSAARLPRAPGAGGGGRERAWKALAAASPGAGAVHQPRPRLKRAAPLLRGAAAAPRIGADRRRRPHAGRRPRPARHRGPARLLPTAPTGPTASLRLHRARRRPRAGAGWLPADNSSTAASDRP